jgi:2-oxoglutarate dehydrogenase E1 component
MARAANTKMDDPGSPRYFDNASLPVLIHGDASFTGQGIVPETLNFSRVPGYVTSGTLHIIANNQLGFTATERESRSSLHASDLAEGFEIPVVHVNADDPQACMEAARTGFAYRHKFHKDFVVNLIGYRRYGHNEEMNCAYAACDVAGSMNIRASGSCGQADWKKKVRSIKAG